MTRVAVTGASGFIGAHVVKALERRGVDVVPLSRSNLAGPAFDLHSADERIFDAIGVPDVLVHLAWGGVRDYHALAHVERELPAHCRFLKLAHAAGVARIVAAGTCFEYGLQEGALSEGYGTRPVTAYGIAKDTLRGYLELLSRESPVEATWARLFYLWGDGQDARSLFPSLKAAAARGDSEFPMSGGEQLRDYLPISEAAGLLADLALAPGSHGTVNVCSGRPVAVRSLVERWIRENTWNVRPALGRYPYAPFEPMAFWGARSKLDAILNPA